MNAGGVVLVIVGIWGVIQVLAGGMLERLGVVKASGASASVQGTGTIGTIHKANLTTPATGG